MEESKTEKENKEYIKIQQKKIEIYEEALKVITTRKMSTFLSSGHMNEYFIKTAANAIEEANKYQN